jgi:hypothetical protein
MYFNTGFEIKDVSSSDSNYFIFSFLKVDLRTAMIEAVDISGIDSTTANRMLMLFITRKLSEVLIMIFI